MATARAVSLGIEDNRLIGIAATAERGYDAGDLHVVFSERRGEKFAALDQPVAFFIPEHIPEPSIRPVDEEVWSKSQSLKKVHRVPSVSA